MPEKTMSFSELAALMEAGAEVDISRRPMVVEQFSELIEKLNQMIALNDERARADLARSQTQLEVLATLQALIRSQGVNRSSQVDLTPLKTVLSEIQAASEYRAKVAYTFDVQRTSQGYLDKITATPIAATLN